jgi:hypothetical protein
MEKKITFDGYNVVIIKKLYPNGDCLCDLRAEVVTDESVQITKQDTDIIFSKPYPFTLTKSDINILTPKQNENKTGFTA